MPNSTGLGAIFQHATSAHFQFGMGFDLIHSSQ